MSVKKISETLRKDLNLTFQSEILIRNFDKVIKSCFLNLIEPSANLKSVDAITSTLKTKQEVQEFNKVYNLMLMLICEIYSLNLTDIELRALVDDLTPTKEFTQSFAEKYQQFKDFIDSPEKDLKETLFNSGINFKKIIDVEWEMLHNVSTKHLLKVNKDIYLITLKVSEENGEIKKIKFKCTYEELLELVTSLQTACRCIGQAADRDLSRIMD